MFRASRRPRVFPFSSAALCSAGGSRASRASRRSFERSTLQSNGRALRSFCCSDSRPRRTAATRQEISFQRMLSSKASSLSLSRERDARALESPRIRVHREPRLARKGIAVNLASPRSGPSSRSRSRITSTASPRSSSGRETSRVPLSLSPSLSQVSLDARVPPPPKNARARATPHLVLRVVRLDEKKAARGHPPPFSLATSPRH